MVEWYNRKTNKFSSVSNYDMDTTTVTTLHCTGTGFGVLVLSTFECMSVFSGLSLIRYYVLRLRYGCAAYNLCLRPTARHAIVVTLRQAQTLARKLRRYPIRARYVTSRRYFNLTFRMWSG
jgi:hypothetical protein